MVQRQSTWHLCCNAFPVYILTNDFVLLRLLTWWCHGQFAPPSVNGVSNQQQHPRGMLCLILSVLPHQCYSSKVDSKQNYLRVHTSNLTEFVSVSVTQHFCSVILKSLDLRHLNDDYNTNYLTNTALYSHWPEKCLQQLWNCHMTLKLNNVCNLVIVLYDSMVNIVACNVIMCCNS